MGLFKKKKEKEEKGANDVAKEVSSNAIFIRVYKNFGSDVSFLMAEYQAKETKDKYNNLVSINTLFSHDEDMDFAEEDVYRELQVILDFKNLSKADRVAKLERKLEIQERLIKYLDRHIEFNALYNYADETVKLRDLRVLLNKVRNHDEKGAFFTIEKGKRVYSFESVDGFLVPLFRGVDSYSTYPDYTRKKKITIQEDQIFEKEMQRYKLETRFASINVIFFVVNMLILIVVMTAGFKAFGVYQNAQEIIHGDALMCAEYTSQINQQYGHLVEMTLLAKLQEQNQSKKPDDGIIPLNPNS